jgi:hypothetical protein
MHGFIGEVHIRLAQEMYYEESVSLVEYPWAIGRFRKDCVQIEKARESFARAYEMSKSLLGGQDKETIKWKRQVDLIDQSVFSWVANEMRRRFTATEYDQEVLK